MKGSKEAQLVSEEPQQLARYDLNNLVIPVYHQNLRLRGDVVKWYVCLTAINAADFPADAGGETECRQNIRVDLRRSQSKPCVKKEISDDHVGKKCRKCRRDDIGYAWCVTCVTCVTCAMCDMCDTCDTCKMLDLAVIPGSLFAVEERLLEKHLLLPIQRFGTLE